MGRFFTPKKRGSIRHIDLVPMLVTELAAWKPKSGGNDETLVFANEAGEPMNYSNMVQRYFFPGIEKSGDSEDQVSRFAAHLKSLLLAQGENIKYVQTQLGHSSPTVTLNVYAHLVKGENQEAACRLENAFFEGTGHNLVSKEEKGLAANC